MRDGIATFGIQMAEPEIDLISKYMSDNGVNGELTVSMFKDLVKAAEMEVPEPGELTTRSICLR
jgi:hypothetical protein